MNDKINGICIGGKFYEAKQHPIFSECCKNCDLGSDECGQCCRPFGVLATFKFSQELTDKLNK